MHKLKTLLASLLMFLTLAPAWAQTAVTSTTLSAAITDTKSQVVVVASASGITAGTALYVDREVMLVNLVNGTTLTVMRGSGSTRTATHASAATVYIAPNNGVGVFVPFAKFGTCTASNEAYLPQFVTNVASPHYGAQLDCYNSSWQVTTPSERFSIVMTPGAQRSASSPTAGANSNLTSQAGGASTSAGTAGAAGGTMTVASGGGGAGASTGTAGAGGETDLLSGAGGAAAGSGGTGGAGGLVKVQSGAGGGTITGGAGGEVRVVAGNGANGSTAGGSGGALNLYSGVAGTGGTGVDGVVTIKKGGSSGTAVFTASAAGAVTVASAAGQNINLTPATTGVVAITNNANAITLPSNGASGLPLLFSCGAALAANGACANTATGGTAHIVYGSAALATNTSTITGISPAFTGTTTFFCVGNDITTRANPVQVIPASSSTITITNTTGASDTIQYICVGY